MLPLSHDEVVYGKGFADRPKCPATTGSNSGAICGCCSGYMEAHPGKKLLFMGGEFGQRREWSHEGSLEWWVLQFGDHAGVQRWVSDLNRLYREEPALYEIDFDKSGFEWIDANDADESVLTFLRRPKHGPPVVIACNFTPVPRYNYVLGVPSGGYWREVLNLGMRRSMAAVASATMAASKLRRLHRTAALFRSP